MCSEEDKLSLASATGDLSSQKSATYLLITKYAGVSTDTVDLLAGRMRARGAYDAEYVANKSKELGVKEKDIQRALDDLQVSKRVGGWVGE